MSLGFIEKSNLFLKYLKYILFLNQIMKNTSQNSNFIVDVHRKIKNRDGFNY